MSTPVITRQGTEHGVRTFTLTFDGVTHEDLPFPTATEAARLFATGRTAEAEEVIYGPIDYGYEGPTCSLCDAVGHGYPGAGPCPLEDRGYDTDGIER